MTSPLWAPKFIGGWTWQGLLRKLSLVWLKQSPHIPALSLTFATVIGFRAAASYGMISDPDPELWSSLVNIYYRISRRGNSRVAFIEHRIFQNSKSSHFLR